MKKSIFFVVALTGALFFAACGGGDNNASTAALENENSSSESVEQSKAVVSLDVNNVILPSDLQDNVEIVSAKKYVDDIDFPNVEITFKLINTINTSSMCTRNGQMWIIGIGQNEDGYAVKEILPDYGEWRCSMDDRGDMFKSFLESTPGETITLEFSGNTSENVKADLEKVQKFELKITEPF